ncbi:hypothetical protein CFC21_067278 [Triticum aestivum]|uniref:Uncharacterized protein n=2 Tax=Triticum aestivum TaxID=4565 RepID=A0A3B6KKM6_WHEAT|nr:hypothetical protein CFC21_067278 [Triticum aestivum]
MKGNNALTKEQLGQLWIARANLAQARVLNFGRDTKLGEYTGICIETSRPDATSFLTARRLIPLTWPTREITENLMATFSLLSWIIMLICCPSNHRFALRLSQIQVRLPNDQIVTGWIEHPGRYAYFFIVNVKDLSGFDAAPVSLDRDIQFEPYRKVAAVWRDFSSGFLRATSRVDLASLSALTSETMLSTCRIDKAGIGGPLVDFDGNFVGMNCSRTRMKKTPYVRREQILQFLRYHRMVCVRAKEEIDDAEEAGIEREMRQLFCSIPGGVAKFFACTGVFIKCNACSATILTSASLIEVCLPNEFRVVGILSRYNLHYNIALVDIMGYWGPLEIKIIRHQVTSCDKAGIGGPLIDTGGNFLVLIFTISPHSPLALTRAGDTIVEGAEKRYLLPGPCWSHGDADTIAEGGVNKWPLPEPYVLPADIPEPTTLDFYKLIRMHCAF